jgi:hypothetical protein
MRSDMKPKGYPEVIGSAVRAIAAMTVLTNLALTNHTMAMPAGPHHSFLTGPWELVVRMGLDGEGLRFPLNVSDENKPQKFDAILPVMGTPIKVRLEEYVPDLKWETTAIKHLNGGIAAKLTIKGKNLEQNIWLCSGDPARQSISSSIGGVAIRRLHNPSKAEKLVRELAHPGAVGTLSVWPEDSNSPFEYVIKVAETIAIPRSKYKLTVVEYIPHYSVDTETKKVVSQSEKPINPAIKVAVHDGEKTFEQWLWAKFPSSPHKETKLPLRMRFTDIDLRGAKGKHILVVASGNKPWLLLSKNRKKLVEKAMLGRFYPFADKAYSFSIEKIMDEAIIKTEWKNNSENLSHPAIIATIEQNDPGRQTVLELNKPFHHKTKFGTLVLLYRRRPPASKAAN